MFACDPLHRQLSSRVLCRRKMPSIDTRLVGVIPGDAKGGEQGLEFQEHRIFPGTHHIGQYSARVRIDRMPQPPCTSFGTDETPHFIELRGASYSNTKDAWTK